MSYYDIDAILTDAQVCRKRRPIRRRSKEHADLISRNCHVHSSLISRVWGSWMETPGKMYVFV